MKKLYLYILTALIIVLIGVGYGIADPTVKQNAPNSTERKFLMDIEVGKIDSDDLILTLKENGYFIHNISHSAVANYMEALANEGILKIIPASYYDYEDVRTSLDVVFEDHENIMKNWDVFEDQWVSVRTCE